MSAGPLPRTTPASQPIAKQEAGRLDLRAGSSPRLNCNPLGLHFVVEIFDICHWRSPFKLACQLRNFKNDAAYIFVSEEIVARELEVVLCAFHVAEERVAAPAGKEAGISCLCNPRLATYGNRCPVDDHPPAIGG